MLRQPLKKHYLGMNKEFRFRGEEPGRLENLSDAVFGMAITLLLISATPPSNFEQVKRFVFELIPFLLCIALIMVVWHEHFVFFLRYGLRDGKVLVLNTLFLIIILFYVYPLKFLTTLILKPIAYLIDNDQLKTEFAGMISNQDIGQLMIIYGVGAASVFFLLMLMYRHALACADNLQLDEIEKFDTRVSVNTNLLLGIVPLISVAVAIIFLGNWKSGMMAGVTYFLYSPLMYIHGRRTSTQRKKLLAELKLSGGIEEAKSAS